MAFSAIALFFAPQSANVESAEIMAILQTTFAAPHIHTTINKYRGVTSAAGASIELLVYYANSRFYACPAHKKGARHLAVLFFER
jgi:hypothetical protein